MSIKIYLITNHADNKKMFYVGQTKLSIEKRFAQHIRQGRRDTNCLLHEALLEYGKRNFTIDILEEVDDPKEADIKETYYIKKYLSHYKDGNGYNMKYESVDRSSCHYHGADYEIVKNNIDSGRAWNYGISLSEESKIKITETKKHRKQAGLYTKYGHKHTDATKKKLSEIASNRSPPSLETKRKWKEQSSNRTFIYNPVSRQRMNVKNLANIPEGWYKGKGTCWVNNGTTSISIDVWDLELYRQKGFKNGRVVPNRVD